jgi:lipopolysaccharide transport system permease protein
MQPVDCLNDMKPNSNIPALDNTIGFWQLVIIKVRFSLRSEASQSYLSYAWWLLEPLLQMGVFYIVFDILLNRGTEDFVAFLLCGIIPWMWFSKSVNQAGTSISRGKGLISQTYLPKPFFPLVIIGQALVKQTFVFLLLFVFLFVYDYFPSIGWLWLIPIVITQLLLIIAISFVVAFVVPFARDIQYLIDAGLRMTMFGSGIFYSYKQVFLPEHREIFLMNPMANLIVNYRRVLMEDIEPLTGSLAIISLVSIVVIFLMTRVMKRYNNTLTLLALE